MPWLEENGLLPGREAPPPGRPTGRGAGALGAGACGPGRPAGVEGSPPLGASWALSARAAGAAGAASGASGATGAAAAGAGGACAAGCAGCGARRGPGRGAPVAGAGASLLVVAPFEVAAAGAWVGWAGVEDATPCPVAVPVGLAVGAAGAGAGAAAFRPAPTSLRKRISAGSSMVELADFTNSPISLNFSRTNLLSTPNSLASSWTRVLATFLLRWPDPRPAVCRTSSGGANSSGVTHRVVMSRCSSSWSVLLRSCASCRGARPPAPRSAHPVP